MNDAERAAALYEQVKHLPFLCECGRTHPLAEHRDCRTKTATAIAAQARQAITKENDHA